MKQLKRKLKTIAPKLGINTLGITSAEPFSDIQKSLQLQQKQQYLSGFEWPDIEDRVDCKRYMPEAKSIIMIGIAYPKDTPYPLDSKQRRGVFARSAWGKDYHHILNNKLRQLKEWLKQQDEVKKLSEPLKTLIQVDTGQLPEVAAAERAGLGFIGKNGLLITPQWGSFVYLGGMITSLPLEPDPPGIFACGSCTRCLDACPTQALIGNGRMNAKRCISYQTQNKEMIPTELRKKLGKQLYGCDICQWSCPFNKHIEPPTCKDTFPKKDTAHPELLPLLTLSNKAFQEQFGSSAGSWRGKRTLQRNAIIALTNVNAREALPTIETLLYDLRPVIRATAVWSVSILGQKDPKYWYHVLTKIQEQEPDPRVLQELKQATLLLQQKISRTD